MVKTITAFLFAVAIVGVDSGAPRATAIFEVTGPQRSLKGDRLMPPPSESACTQAAWPHYENRCMRSRTQPDAQPREVRIVSIDRLLSKHPAGPSAY
jgi:hypothetical protein